MKKKSFVKLSLPDAANETALDLSSSHEPDVFVILVRLACFYGTGSGTSGF